MATESPELVLPEDFREYAWEIESKGVFWDARVRYDGKEFAVVFYEPERLAQDASEELNEGNPFFEKNVIVISKVTESEMNTAISRLAKDGRIAHLKEV